MAERIPRVRLLVVFTGIGLFAIVLVIRFGAVMIPDSASSGATSQSTGVVERGPILDRNGKILAIQTELNTVTAWAPNVTDPVETAKLLSGILGIPEDQILEKMRGSSDFAIIARTISPTDSDAIKKLKSENKLKGVSLQPDYGRSYPEKSLASHLLGFVGVDNHGLSGIEYELDNELSPQKSAGGAGRTYGNQVFLTIDSNIQYKMEQIAQEVVKEHNPDAVMLLAMDARNGDVLSYAALPDFDPNQFDQTTPQQRRDWPVAFLYEPGSVFKMFSISSIFQLGGITLNDYFNANGIYNNVSPPITDLGAYGRINAEGIIKYSSNVGASYASETVSVDNLYHMLRQYGFGEQTGVSLPGEEKGILRTPEFWTPRSKPSITFGQEVSVTALQMITAATAIANKGILLKPHVVKRIVSPSGKLISEYGREPVREVVAPWVAQDMLDFMQAATEPGGTAIRAYSDQVPIVAKTGTAEVWDRNTNSYSKTDFIASCMAILPKNDPQVIVYVVIINPKKNGYLGGIIAAPVIHEATDFLIPYLGIPRKDDVVVEKPNTVTVVKPVLPDFTDTLPDFTGLPKRVLLPLFQRKDLHVTINGSGWVVHQSPPPGTGVTPGMDLTLDLN